MLADPSVSIVMALRSCCLDPTWLLPSSPQAAGAETEVEGGDFPKTQSKPEAYKSGLKTTQVSLCIFPFHLLLNDKWCQVGSKGATQALISDINMVLQHPPCIVFHYLGIISTCAVLEGIA